MTALEKISSYNLVTNLIPGTILLEALRVVGLPLASSDNFAPWIILSYSLGLLSSRIGSLFIDPVIRRFKSTTPNTYEEFIRCSQSDSKIEILLETANGYRTAMAACLLFLLTIPTYSLMKQFEIADSSLFIFSVAGAMIIFLISYLKQSKYVAARVEAHRIDDGKA